MKAIQTRSPIHLAYEYANLNNVIVSIWVSDTVNIDITTTPDYQLNSQAINDFATVEISELIRSKNDYIFNPDFYEKRDTAKYVLIRGELLDSSNSELEVKYDLLRIRDGYVQRTENPQIYQNLISTDPNNYDLNTNTTIADETDTPFGTGESYRLEDITEGQRITLEQTLNLTGVYTFSAYVKFNNSGREYSLGAEPTKRVVFDLIDNDVSSVVGTILAYDLTEINGWVKISVCLELDSSSNFIFRSEQPPLNENVLFFNPTIVKGNQLNQSASDLILQDNTTTFSDGIIQPLIGLDLKLGNSYNYGISSISFTGQSIFTSALSSTLSFTDLNGVATTQQTKLVTLDECKHTPTKVSFINRFGVIQDLVFFKKRIDNIDTDKESYKTNVLQQGNYYPHIGQNQTIRKESKRSVTLNTGFYSEEFNTVFEQLQNSLHYWIDDEPAVLEGSTFNVKTRVNDKLINYTFDFSYSNEEVNTI
jgi:hypothetical protein